MGNTDIIRVEITDTAPMRVAGQHRWVGKAKFPKALRARAIVIFQFGEELVAIPSACPHEHANLAEARFVGQFVLECPLHQNTYDLSTGAIKSFKVIMDGEQMFLLWHRDSNEPVTPQFSSVTAVATRSADEKVATLEQEITLLKEASELRQKQVIETLKQMDGMIREVEDKRAAVEQAHARIEQVNEFVARVMATMSEALLVVDPQGQLKEANQRFAALTGSGREEVLKRSLGDLFDGDALAAISRATSSAQSEGVEFEAVLSSATGEQVEHLMRTAPLFGRGGKREGTVVVGTDIRRMKQAQREVAAAYAKVQSLLDSMRQGVFVVLQSGVIVDPVSRFSSEIFARPIVGANLFDVLYKDLDRSSEAFQLLEMAFLTTFGAEDFQWDVMADHFPRRVLYRREGEEAPAILRVDYCPLRSADGLMDRLMIVVDDVTKIELLEHERQTHERRANVLNELAAVKREHLRDFFRAALSQVREARGLLRAHSPEATTALFRTLHTLKGNARVLHLSLIGRVTHDTETAAEFLREGSLDKEQAAAARERLFEQLTALRRQVVEYSDVAEHLLHVPNDDERVVLAGLDDAMLALDEAIAARNTPAVGLVLDAGLKASLDAVRVASDAADCPPLTHELSRLEYALATSAPPGEVQRLHHAVASAAVERAAASSTFTLSSLSVKAWAAMYHSAFQLTRLLSEPDEATALARAQALERALSVADSLHHGYAKGLLNSLASAWRSRSPRVAQLALRELWRHLSLHSMLEGLATLRPDERASVSKALEQLEGEDELLRLVAEGRVRVGSLSTFLDLVRREGGGASVLATLRQLFGASPSDLAAQFCTTIHHDDTSALALLDAGVSREAIDGYYTACGGHGSLFVEASELNRPYAKQLDIVRLARTVRAFTRGNFQLLFDHMQTVEVMVPRVHALQASLAAMRSTLPSSAFEALDRMIGELFEVPILPSFSRFYDMVNDVAQRLGKRVDLRLTGDATLSVPREQLPRIQDAFVHLLRNSLDHGLESPADRLAAGKHDTGSLYAAVTALEKAMQCAIGPNGTRVRNACLAAEEIQSDTRHAFLMFTIDLCNAQYKDRPLYAEVVEAFEPFKGRIYREVVVETKKILEIVALYGGQWPHSSHMVPGGVVSTPNRRNIVKALGIVDAYTRWYERTILGCSLERWARNRTLADVLAWVDEAEAHRDSAMGLFVRFTRALGLEKLGRGRGNMLSYGVYFDPVAWQPPFAIQKTLRAAGFYDANEKRIKPFSQTEVAEHVKHSWFKDHGTDQGAHPFAGETVPQYAPGTAKYSWAKAPRYAGEVVETGCFPELFMAGDALIQSLFELEGTNVWSRQFARLHRPTQSLPLLRATLLEIEQHFDDPFYEVPSSAQVTGEGFGLVQAARGALGHWVQYEGGKISRYQIVTPTAWNASPRDSSDRRGHWEQTLLGTPIPNEDDPIELGHVIRSHDACLVCTVHFIGSGRKHRFGVA